MSMFDNVQVMFEGSRVIALKNSDMERLSEEEVKKHQASSFTSSSEVVEEIPVQEQTVIVEAPQEEVVSEVVNPVVPEPVVTSEVSQSANIFDQELPVLDQNVVMPQVEQVNPVVQPIPSTQEFTPVYENAPVLNEVPLPKQEEVVSTLDTPQTFFDRVEKSEENNFDAQGYEPEDSALITLANLEKLIKDKNAMIQALSDKIIVLEEQLRVSEESRKVSEAQKAAAESTLQAARTAEAQGGPTLVYQQQNYQQAA